MMTHLWRFLPYLMEQYGAKGCRQSAAALTYMTLFAIVPMMTVTYSMFSLVPAFQGVGEQLQGMIFDHFVPSTGQELGGYLKGFSDQARSLTLVGVGMLVVTAYLMLKNIEQVFNDIWGVKEPRKGLSNFLLYWAVLSLGPILLGAGVAMSTYLLSLRLFVAEFDALGIVPFLLKFLPWVLTACAFTLLFAAVPNCRVPVRHAAVGGAVTALLFELLKELFAFIVARSDLQVIYGAFAVVPLFLLWIYILWMVLLGGALLVRSMSTYQVEVVGKRFPDLVAALLALWALRERQVTGESATDADIVKSGVGDEQWQQLRQRLLKKKIIAKTLGGEYVLSRDLYRLSLRQLADVVELENQMPGVSDYLQTFAWFPPVAARLLSVDQHTEVQFDTTVGELFAVEAEPEPEYPDEGEGLEQLREELKTEAGIDAETEADTDAEIDTEIEPEIEPETDSPVGAITASAAVSDDREEDQQGDGSKVQHG
jgi:membrane protein